MLEKFKIGILGLKAEHKAKVDFLQRHISQMDIIAAHAPTNNDILFSKNDLGLSYNYDDPKKLANNNDLDAVLIWSSAVDHAKHAIIAIESNKHVFIQQPLATNYDDGLAVFNAAKKKASLISYCPFDYIHNPLVQKANELIDKGEIGVPVMIQAHQSGKRSQVNSNSGQASHRNIFTELAPELVAMSYYLTGKRIESVRSFGKIAHDSTLKLTNDVDVAQVQAKMSDGCFAQFSLSKVDDSESSRIFIQGSKSELSIDHSGLHIHDGDSITHYSNNNYLVNPDKFLLANMNSFIRQLVTRGKAESSLSDALYTSQVVSAMGRSYLMKETVSIEEK